MKNLRIKKVQKWLLDNKIDSFIVTKIQNIRYLTGFTGSTAILLVFPNKVLFITDSRYVEQAEKETDGVSVVPSKGLIKTVIMKINKKKIRKAAFESDNINYNVFSVFSKNLKKVKLIPKTSVIERIRSIKTMAEIKLIKKGVDTTLITLDRITKLMKEGVTEKDIAVDMEYIMKKNGVEKKAFDFIVASGKRSSLPHGVASSKKIKKGDLITFDVGAVCDGYHSDLTRTYSLSIMTRKQKEIYDIVYKAQQAAINEIASGISARYIDGVSRDVIKKHGYGKFFGHGLGHGVGLEIHELPRLTTASNDILIEGMVVTVEPGIYLPGWGGIRIEDCIVVTKRGCCPLANAPSSLQCI